MSASQAPKPTDRNYREALFRNFACVDEFGNTLKSGSYSAIVGGFAQFRIIFGNARKRFEAARSRLGRELQLIGEMYLEKASLYEKIVSAFSSMRLDSVYRKSLFIYFSTVIDWYNNALGILRENPQLSAADIPAIEAEIADIKTRATTYEVTAPYLKLGREKLPRGTPFAVLDVQGNKALVLALAESSANDPIRQWTSLSSLIERTTWTSNSEIAYRRSLRMK